MGEFIYNNVIEVSASMTLSPRSHKGQIHLTTQKYIIKKIHPPSRKINDILRESTCTFDKGLYYNSNRFGLTHKILWKKVQKILTVQRKSDQKHMKRCLALFMIKSCELQKEKMRYHS